MLHFGYVYVLGNKVCITSTKIMQIAFKDCKAKKLVQPE